MGYVAETEILAIKTSNLKKSDLITHIILDNESKLNFGNLIIKKLVQILKSNKLRNFMIM